MVGVAAVSVGVLVGARGLVRVDPRGWGDVHGAGDDLCGPAVVVHDAVMVVAEQGAVAGGRRSAVGPVNEVMSLRQSAGRGQVSKAQPPSRATRARQIAAVTG